ncbi:MAG: DUF805 domain-containing protein [Rhizobiales bacterium]|nr:DUF805 domain-containing protein [Hyphomicrobiales bacterium]
MDIGWLLTSFEGRINRAKWWLGLVILVIVQWIVWYIVAMTMGIDMMAANDPAQMEEMMMGLGIPILIISLIFLYPSLALYTKRWHDRGKSGWWTLIILIPLIGGIWALIELGILRGTIGPNQYGPDPLG